MSLLEEINGSNGFGTGLVVPSDVVITEKPAKRASRAKPKRFAVIWQSEQIWTCEAADAQAALELAEKVTGWSKEEIEIREAGK